MAASAGANTGGNRREEMKALRARRSELEEQLAAARSDLASSRERREFMQDEAEQAREYSSKLAQELSRLARIEQSLLPDQRCALESLRRLVATLATLEEKEKSTRESFRTQEAELRAEIDDFTGGATAVATAEGPMAPRRQDPIEAVDVTQGMNRRGSGNSSCFRDSWEDPLAENNTEDAQESYRQRHVHQAPERLSLEANAVLAEGLHRIEAVREAAAAEREMQATRLSRLRLAIARRQREEDGTPGHAELLQYLLRFEELGRHAREREKQLRRCQAERSTLALTREILADESRMLETVAGGVDEAAQKQKAAREVYMRQLEAMIKSVEDCLSNQTRLLDVARSRRNAAEETQEAVMEERKRFLKGARDLDEAGVKYEGLKAHLSLMRR